MKYSGLFFLIALCAILTTPAMSQDELPLREIPEYPEEYTPETVAARLIEGLGFRYYWATEGLRAEDLEYKPSPEARTCGETLEHIYGLCEVTYSAVFQKTAGTSKLEGELSFDQKRKATLELLDAAAVRLRSGEVTLNECVMVFERGDSKSEYPFWNSINGPISDALWHCGQIVSFRRASGNPLPPGVSVFSGKKRD